ncbi:MAG: histidine--tRNA ligase [Acidobacteriota bacterium]
MSSSPRSVKGTRDLLPDLSERFSRVETVARETFRCYGYREIRTPILEPTELFVRGVGESSDIVGKEMYTFDDKRGRSVTLRPENTAAVARAFIEHGMAKLPQPVKLFYIGPQFRYERPQKGRYRQFHQIGAELLGDEGPWTDVELLLMLVRFLDRLGFEDLVVRLNTVGNPESRSRYADVVRAHLEPHRQALSEDSQRRLETNPLRILDTKIPAERELLEGLADLSASLSPECRSHFDAVCASLHEFDVPYAVDARLVRGLDYYTRTVFEISSDALGAQDAILGGGRYDRLVSDLGGPEIPGIGFAIGEDRLVELLEAPPEGKRPHLHIVPAGTGSAAALQVCEVLRAHGLSCEAELGGRSVNAAFRRAGKAGASHFVVVGEEEWARGCVSFKNLDTGEQQELTPQQITEQLGASPRVQRV